MRPTLSLLALSLALPVSLQAASVHTFRFAEADLRFLPRDGHVEIRLPGEAVHADEPGAPCVPARFVNILVPPGATVTGVKVRAPDRILRRGVSLLPVQPSVPHDGRRTPRRVGPNAALYASAALHPDEPVRLLGVGTMRGYTLAHLELNPVRYRGAGGEVHWADEIEVELELAEADRSKAWSRPAPADFQTLVRSLVVNPEAVAEPAVGAALAPGGGAGTESVVDYLIITSTGLSNAWQALATHRAARDGLVCEVKTVDSITATYSGRDVPEKIRNGIVDYVNTRSTRFVLLGGDGESNHPAGTGNPVVPCRYAKAKFRDDDTGRWLEEEFPCDLYYADTTGDWDKDGDNIFGETSTAYGVEGDMLPDVFLARVPVRNTTNIGNFVNKLINFENAPPDAAFYRRILLIANKGFSSFTGDARPADLVDDGLLQFREHSPVSDCEIWSRRLYRDFVQTHGFVPSDFKLFTDTLTSYDGTNAPGSYELNRANLKNKINDGGRYYLFSAAHGYSLGWYMEPENNAFAVADVKALTQKAVIVNTIACSTADFDGYEDPTGNYESCISDAFLRVPSHGAMAYIGCSGLSIGSLADPAGGACFRMAGSVYAEAVRQFHPTLGEAFSAAKAAYAGQCNADGDYRYQAFSLILQGDPAMTLMIGCPSLEITCAPDSATLGWPAAASNYVLQASTSLGGEAQWLDVPGVPVLVGGQLHCEVPATNPAAFFRLRGE